MGTAVTALTSMHWGVYEVETTPDGPTLTMTVLSPSAPQAKTPAVAQALEPHMLYGGRRRPLQGPLAHPRMAPKWQLCGDDDR